MAGKLCDLVIGDARQASFSRVAHRAICAAGAVALLSACSSTGQTPVPATPNTTATTTTTTARPAVTTTPPPPAVRTKNWFDLDVGDCVAAIPAVDVGEVSSTVVDCAATHQAEVFLRSPTAVDTAIADVANRVCTDGVPAYTGGPAAGGLYVTTYLIDSNQDRTDHNPLPSTIICLLQAAGGGELTGTARKG
jgi:hypothetical protein